MRIIFSVLFLLISTISQAIELRVDINGLDDRITQQVKYDLKLYNAIVEPKLNEQRIKNLYDLAPTQITDTLNSLGYYNSEINSSLKSSNDTWTATFNVKQGPPTIITNVTLSATGIGANDPRVKKVLVAPKLITGTTIIHDNYEETKEKLLVDLNALGYLRADFSESVIEIDRNTNIARITLVLDTGEQYRFGRVNFINNRYPDSLLNRYIPFSYGDPYTIEGLIDFQNNLESSELFNKIRFDPIMSQDPDDILVPIDVRLTPKPRNRYTGSIGYGTDTNFRGSLGWLHRFSSPAGHKLSANLSASAVKSAAKLNYIIPGKHAATDQYVFGVVGQLEKFDDTYSRKAEIFANKSMRQGKLESVYGVNFFTETFHLTSFEDNRNRNYLLPNAKWIWTDAHQAKFYEYGTQIEFSLRGAVKGLASDNSVFETIFRGKKIIPLTDPMRIILRGDIGAIASENFSELPPSLRFYTGGDTTVRGFRYNSLGPKDRGEVIGGKYLSVVSAEIEHRVYENLSGVVFIDSGNANNKFAQKLGTGAGAGIRYKTPIGDFKLDVAKPLNIEKDWRIHFNFGTDF